MDRNDRLGAVGCAPLATLEITRKGLDADVAGIRVDVDEDRTRAGLDNCRGGRDERHGDRYYLVPGTNAGREQRESQRVGTAAYPDDMSYAEKCRKLLFEGGNGSAPDVGGVLVYFSEFALDLFADFPVLGRQVDELDLHRGHSPPFAVSCRRTRAGCPVTTERAGTSCVTSAPAPTIAPSPISTPHMITAPLPIEAARRTIVCSMRQSLSSFGAPSKVAARGLRSLMNTTPWPTKTSSSIVTPVHTKLWLEILHRCPTFAPRCTSTKAPMRVSAPISQP